MRGWWWAGLVVTWGCGESRSIGEDDPDWSSWDDAPTTERLSVTVAHWNVQELGPVGSEGYEAVVSVLKRLNADVVCLNEIDVSDHPALGQLADEAGYATVLTAADQPFGSIGNAVLSRFAARQSQTPDGAALSGDPTARDLTRLPVVFTAGIPGTGAELTVVSHHLKSGFEDADLFRRAVDAERVAQAAELGQASEFLLVLGDVNEDVVDLVEPPPLFTSLPGGLSSDYRLGADLRARVDGEGLSYAPFGVFSERGLEAVDAPQRDGTTATRPTSGRRIDYVFASEAVRSARLRAETYDCRDEATPDLPEGLATGAPVPGDNDCNHAADHLPLLVRFEVPKR